MTKHHLIVLGISLIALTADGGTLRAQGEPASHNHDPRWTSIRGCSDLRHPSRPS